MTESPRWEAFLADCVDPNGREVEIANVCPLYGPKHEPHPDCWCEPNFDDGVLVHNEVH